MASVNRVTIIGHLGRDPESHTFDSGDIVANLAVATSETWKDKNTGEKKQATEWHRVNAHGKLAEICCQYLRKGSLVYIEGSLRTRKYQKDGVDHYATEIRADQMRMLDRRQDGQQGAQDHDQGQAPAPRQQAAPRDAAPQRQAPQPAGGGYSNSHSVPPQSAGSGFDDLEDIPFRDPLSYRGVHLAL